MQTIPFKTLKRRLIIGLLLVSFLLSSAPAVLADSPPQWKPPGAHTDGYSWGG